MHATSCRTMRTSGTSIEMGMMETSSIYSRYNLLLSNNANVAREHISTFDSAEKVRNRTRNLWTTAQRTLFAYEMTSCSKRMRNFRLHQKQWKSSSLSFKGHEMWILNGRCVLERIVQCLKINPVKCVPAVYIFAFGESQELAWNKCTSKLGQTVDIREQNVLRSCTRGFKLN